MTEPLPRKRFQIHLSTAIVMMFVAAALIWANATTSRSYQHAIVEEFKIVNENESQLRETIQREKAADKNFTTRLQIRQHYGWPIWCLAYEGHAEVDNVEAAKEAPIKFLVFLEVEAAVDGGVALAILIAVCFLCESLIRRRAARKGS